MSGDLYIWISYLLVEPSREVWVISFFLQLLVNGHTAYTCVKYKSLEQVKFSVNFYMLCTGLLYLALIVSQFGLQISPRCSNVLKSVSFKIYLENYFQKLITTQKKQFSFTIFSNNSPKKPISKEFV